jgi:hypothetical protein
LHSQEGPSGHGTVWSASASAAGRLQQGAVQVVLRALMRCLTLRLMTYRPE